MSESFMLGYDKLKAYTFIHRRLKGKELLPLLEELPALVTQFIDLHISYLHFCCALDDSGDTGEGEYDEDEAFDFIFFTLSKTLEEPKHDALSMLVEQLLLLQDDFMQANGLM